MRANHKPLLVAEEGHRTLKQNTENTKKAFFQNYEDVCHAHRRKSADHKQQVKE